MAKLKSITFEAAGDRFRSLALIIIILWVSTFFPGFQGAFAEDDDPPAWRRVRTNSVPYQPQNLTVDSTGTVWVTASEGSEYDSGVWLLPSGDSSARFQFLTTSRANNWLEGDFNHVVEKPQLESDVRYVMRDDAGNVWYALNNRIVLCEKADGSWQTFAMENTYDEFYGVDTTGVDSAHIIRLINNRDGTQDVLLIAAKSIKRVDSAYNVVETRIVYSIYNNDLIRDAYVDSHGRYWVANEYGVQFGDSLLDTTFPSVSDEYKDDPEVPPYNPYDPDSAPAPITGIMEDSLGNMWFINGTYGATGVYCLTSPDSTNHWIHYNINELTGSRNQVFCMTPGTDGVMWFGVQNSGIVKYTPGETTAWTRTTCAELGVESEQVLGMQEHNGTLWFTTGLVINYGSGVHAWYTDSPKDDPQVFSYNYRKSSTSLTSNRITAVAGDLSGGVWFGAYDHPSVARLKADGTWVQYQEDTMDLTWARGTGSITGIGVDSNNVVFMAPNRRAPLAYDITTEGWLDLPAGPSGDTFFYGLYVDPKDGKWFCGADVVYHLNADNTAWTTYDTTDDTRFPDYRVQYALMDGEENMWFMSTFITGKVSVMKKDPENGDPAWSVFVNGDDSGYLGGTRVFLDRNGEVWNSAGQKFDSATGKWVTQTDTALFDTRPMRFLNGDIPVHMDLTDALRPITSTDQVRMTVDTGGNVVFSTSALGLSSINAGVIMRSPVKGDITRDCRIQLDDAVLSMRYMTGMASGIQSGPADVNGDGRVDMVECLYVLQAVAGLRPGAGENQSDTGTP